MFGAEQSCFQIDAHVKADASAVGQIPLQEFNPYLIGISTPFRTPIVTQISKEKVLVAIVPASIGHKPEWLVRFAGSEVRRLRPLLKDNPRQLSAMP